MRQDIYDALRRYWGYDSFRECQEEIILSILDGKDTLGLLPTGGGKSLTFQIPALIFNGLTIVVTPLIALMKDQVDALRERRIKATFIHSGMRPAEVNNAVDKCLYGKYKFLYISPERLSSTRFIDWLRQMPVSFIAVDEAHCISQWGYDFRPSYLNIALIRDIFPDAPVLALTASATPEVTRDIMEKLRFRFENVIRKSFRRNNISYIVRRQENKMEKLQSVLAKTLGSGIIYVRSRDKAKEIATSLKKEGYSIDYYHAGLSTEEKRDKQDKWKSGEIRIIVATNAFGMGIDKPNVRLVAHLDVPNSLEEYYQEAGRAGRDGNRSYALLLISARDKATLQRRVAEAFPPKDFLKQVYVAVCDFLTVSIGGGFDCLYDFNLNTFCSTFRLPERATYNALKLLTACDVINFIDETDTMSRIMILVTKQELYNVPGMTEEMDNILEIILRNYSGLFADYVFINESAIAYRYQIPLEKVCETLIWLSRARVLSYIPRKRTAYIYFPRTRMEPGRLQIPDSIYTVGKQRMERRVNAMIDYTANISECRESKIIKYFGEDTTCGCGHCDVCVERKKASSPTDELAKGIDYMLSLKPRAVKDIIDTLRFGKDDILAMVRKMCDEGHLSYDGRLLHLNK